MKSNRTRQKTGQINIVLQGKSIQKETESQDNLKVKQQFFHIDDAFASFIGLDHFKKVVKQIYATKRINDKRREMGLSANNQVLHMLFKGNPGTGKTTIARKLASFYFKMNLLSKGHFIEAERADLVGEYIGQTAQKTRALIQKAHGGILFIDEAYSLARGGEKDFGKEAIDTLVTHMENEYEDFVLILAGYPDEMDDFLALNPGLKSRFPFIMDFENFTIEQLMKIAKSMIAEREYQFTEKAEEALRLHLIKKFQMLEHNFSNGRYVRNVIEQAIRNHAVRLVCQDSLTTSELITLTDVDVRIKE